MQTRCCLEDPRYETTSESLTAHLSVLFSCCLSDACLSTYPTVCLCVCPSVRLSVRLSVCLSVYLPVYLSVCLPAYLSVCLSDCLCIFLSVYMSVSLSACLFALPVTCPPLLLLGDEVLDLKLRSCHGQPSSFPIVAMSSPANSRTLLPMTSKADKLPLETEPVAHDNNTN